MILLVELHPLGLYSRVFFYYNESCFLKVFYQKKMILLVEVYPLGLYSRVFFYYNESCF